MLSDEVLEKVSERLVDRIESANLYIIKKIGSNLDELGKLSYSEAQQLAQIMKYGGDYEKIIKKLSDVTQLNEKDIRDIFDEVAQSEYDFAQQFYNYKSVPYIPYDKNYALKQQVETIASITQRSIRGMMNPSVLGYGMINKETGEVTFKGLQQAYYDMIDEAVLSISQGKETFDEVVSRQIEQMGGGGLKTVYNSTYMSKDGIILNRTRRLDSAIRMNMQDGLRTLHNETQERFGKEFGSDGVEISVHNYPAPDHAEMQGRQFSTKEYEKLQLEGVAKDYKGKLIDIRMISKKGNVSHRPVSQYNCYHYTFAIVLGVSSPEYSDEQLQQIIDDNNEGFEMDGKHYTTYEGSQMQRRLETKIREQKDIQIMSKEAGQMEKVRKAQQKITQLTTKYKEISDKAGLPTKMDRLKVSGYKRVKVDNNNIKQKLSQNNITLNESLFSKEINQEVISKSLNKVDDLVNKYPILKDKIKKDGLSIGVDYDDYAGTVSPLGDEINLSKRLYQDKTKLLSTIKEGQDDNWSAKIKEKDYDIYTITHETGHILEDAIIAERIKTKEGYDLNELMWNNQYYAMRFKRQEDTDIFNEIFLPVSEETGISWKDLETKYISDYGRSEMNYEWFAELFTKMELGESDIMTDRLKEYLEGELWRK